MINSAAVTITVEGLAIGQQVDFAQDAVGQITFAAGTGVTLKSSGNNLLTAGEYSVAGVKCIGTDIYLLVGDLGS